MAKSEEKTEAKDKKHHEKTEPCGDGMGIGCGNPVAHGEACKVCGHVNSSKAKK